MSTGTCAVCDAYLQRRADVISEPIALRAFLRGVDPTVVAREYMHAVHRRHLAGGSLSTRTSTPAEALGDGRDRMHVKRCCNGCGEPVGDVTGDELDAAVYGRPLPDVRIECGCHGSARDRSAA